MEELLKLIVRPLVEKPDEITVITDDPDAEGVVTYHLRVAQGDMGRVIGKQGRIAKAIRVVMRAAANKEGNKISVDIDDVD